MSRRNPSVWRNVLLPVLVMGLVVGVQAAGFNAWLGDLSHLKSEKVIITLLASTVLLLFGVLMRLRQLRVALEQKSEALIKSERHIRLLGDNLPNVTIFQLEYVPENVFRFTYLSKGYERTLGLDRERVYQDARLAYDHIYEDDLPVLLKAFHRGREALEPADLEIRALDAEGALKWLRVSAVPHMDEDVLMWDGFMQDISVTKHVEDALLEENRNFQNLFETIDDFLMVCDLNGKLLHTNPSVEKRLDYSRAELKDMSVFELYDDESRTEMYQMIALMRSEQSVTCGTPIRAKSGTLIPVEMSIFQGYWKNSPAIFGVARDIGTRQRTESALRESQRMLRLIMDTIPMSVFWKDQDSVYLGCNKTFIRECGLETIEDVVGRTPYDLFPPTFAEEVTDRDQEVIHTNQALFNVTQSHTKTDGSVGWREINKIPLRDEDHQAVGVLGVWRDITEQNRAEERLKRTLEDMERFNQLMRGRERRTLELKAEINALLRQQGHNKKYTTTTEDLA